MASWKYIITVILVLIGGFFLFGRWSLDQFSLAFDSIDLSYDQAATARAALDQLRASKKTENQNQLEATTTPNFEISFPNKGVLVYTGCDYKINWQASSSIKSIDLALIDAGTQKPAGPIASGLNSTSTSQDLLQLDWHVGNVWPGEYYILVSKINGQETKIKSTAFSIEKYRPNGSCE